MPPEAARSTLSPYTTLFRSAAAQEFRAQWIPVSDTRLGPFVQLFEHDERYLRTFDLETLGLEENHQLGTAALLRLYPADRKSTRLNSSHGYISYAVFCLKKK